MKVFRTIGFCALILTSTSLAITVAVADIGPPPQPSTCTVDHHSTDTRQCRECYAHSAAPDRCTETMADSGMVEVCRTPAQQRWREVWCTDEAAASQPSSANAAAVVPPASAPSAATVQGDANAPGVDPEPEETRSEAAMNDGEAPNERGEDSEKRGCQSTVSAAAAPGLALFAFALLAGAGRRHSKLSETHNTGS